MAASTIGLSVGGGAGGGASTRMAASTVGLSAGGGAEGTVGLSAGGGAGGGASGGGLAARAGLRVDRRHLFSGLGAKVGGAACGGALRGRGDEYVLARVVVVVAVVALALAVGLAAIERRPRRRRRRRRRAHDSRVVERRERRTDAQRAAVRVALVARVLRALVRRARKEVEVGRGGAATSCRAHPLRAAVALAVHGLALRPIEAHRRLRVGGAMRRRVTAHVRQVGAAVGISLGAGGARAGRLVAATEVEDGRGDSTHHGGAHPRRAAVAFAVDGVAQRDSAIITLTAPEGVAGCQHGISLVTLVPHVCRPPPTTPISADLLRFGTPERHSRPSQITNQHRDAPRHHDDRAHWAPMPSREQRAESPLAASLLRARALLRSQVTTTRSRTTGITSTPTSRTRYGSSRPTA